MIYPDIKLQEVDDGSGDVFFELPPELIKDLKLKEGDEFEINSEHGHLLLTLKR